MVFGMAEAGQHCDEPLQEKEEGHPYPGHFGRARPRGDHPLQMGRLLLMDKTSPEVAGRFWSMWQCAGIIWHVWQLVGALKGPTFCFLDAELAKKGPTSPSEGLDVSFLAHIMTFLSI